jgi:hypothetical protein
MSAENEDDKRPLTESEIAARMDSAVRRALNTPPTPTKELVGKTERAHSQRESRALRRKRAPQK